MGFVVWDGSYGSYRLGVSYVRGEFFLGRVVGKERYLGFVMWKEGFYLGRIVVLGK